MDLTDIQNQVLLVMCVVAGVKRHFTQVKGWKSLAVVLVVAVAVAYGIAYWNHPLPAGLEPLRQALKVLAYAIGGHAYISGALKKLGGAGTNNLAGILSGLLGTQSDSATFTREEQPTKPEGRSLPPAKTSDGK